MTLGHFGLLRASEFTIPSQGKFDPCIHLTMSDVTFHQIENGSPYMVVFIKRSKTDLYKQGAKIHVGCSKQKVCAYCAMLEYIKLASASGKNGPMPLFQFQTGAVLTKHLLVQQTRLYLSLAGIAPDRFTSHSYRLGGASAMASAGMADWEIKLGGRWRSDTYQRYIKAPPNLLVSFAERMATPLLQNSHYQQRNPYINNIFKI